MGVVVIVVVAGVVLGLTDPFKASGQSGSGVSDNAYPTSTATVTEQSLSSQTQVDATLGYGGSYTVSTPSGVGASTLSSDEATVKADQEKVAADQTALSSAKALATPDNAATLLAAKAAITSDETALAQANSQLASDRRLSCPAASSATVTTATGSTSAAPNTGSSGSGSTGSGTSSAGTGSGTGSTGSGSSTPAGTTGSEPGDLSAAPRDPGGAATTYYFEYGTSVDYGQTTAAKNAGSGSAQVAVTLKLSGLSPGQTYYYRLVAKNSVGTSYGQGATFQTTSPPSAVTGTATTVTASSEMLSGTVDPGGLETSYYFEWGRTASFGERTASQDAGAASAAASVSRLATGLQPDATYIFRLVAKSSLGTSFGTPVTFETAESSCLAETQVISEDAQGLKTAKDALSADQLGAGASVTTDEQTLSSDEQSLAAAQQALSADESRAMNPNTTFTAIPATGQILSRGSNVYSLDGLPVPLFYGTVIPDRALYLGVADGPDVTQLQANLIALGFGSGISATAHFSSATEQAVKTWQASLGVPATGVVALGDFVLEPGPIEVDTVSASLGETAAQPGSSVLTATSTSRVVTIALDAAQQSEVKVGDPVTITLPNNNTTPGVVSSVGTVATSSSSGAGNTGGGGSSSTITVVVTPTDPSATGAYDQAPVEVSITNASVASALVVPVDALLALSGGGYALEEIGKGKVHHLVPVSLGLFDDADGLVQVSGPGVAAGQRVVVPAL